MRKCITIIGMLVLFCVTIMNGVSMPQEEKSSILGETVSKITVGTDPHYSAFLEQRNHRSTLAAPDFLRKLAVALPFVRMEMQRSVEFSVHGLIFHWYIGEFAAAGTSEEVLEKIKTILDEEGFLLAPQIPDIGGYSFSKVRADYLFSVDVLDFQDYEGGRETRCGGSLRILINTSLTGLQYTCAQLIEELPDFTPEGFPAEILEILKDIPVNDMSFGGTWEQYYTWSIGYRFPEKGTAEEVTAHLQKKLESLGYVLSHDERNTKTYFLNKSDPPVIYLHMDDEYSFSIRVQPQM